MTKWYILTPLGLYEFFLLVGLVSLIGVQLTSFADDPGVGWHLATGEFILQHLQIPFTDPFLAPVASRPWVSDQWLSDIILTILFRAGGWPLLYAALTSIYLLTLLGILYVATRRLYASSMASLVAILFAFKLGQVHFILRPVLFAFFFFALVASWAFTRQKQLECKAPITLPRWHYVALPALFAFWANMHPSFLLGIALLFSLPMSHLLSKFIYGSPLKVKETKHLSVLAVICLLTTLVNPYGIKLHASIVSLGTSSFFMTFHEEWRGLAFSEYEGKIVEVLLATLVLAYFLLRTLPRISLFSLLSFLFFGHLALQSVRVLPFFGVISCFIVADLLGREFLTLRAYVLTPLQSLLRRLNEWESKRPISILSCLVASIWLIGGALSFGKVPFYYGEYGPSALRYPHQGVNWLKSNVLSSSPATVGSVPEWGGFLVWYGEGRVRPIIDDRNSLLGEAFYKEYLAAMTPVGDWKGYLAAHGVQYILLPAKSPLTYSIKGSRQATLLYEDSVGTVFSLP